MLPDLDRLIRLQRLDNAAVATRRTAEAIPERIADLDARVTAGNAAVDAAKQRLADAKAERQVVEKSLAEVQSRLSRFKTQLMAVKTNKEYTAVQHEIGTAEAEVGRLEDDVLEHMLAADDLTATVEAAEAALKADQTEVERERGELEAERAELEQRLGTTTRERTALAEDIGDGALRLFETIARQRGGVAVVEAREGLCTLCNVRLRPQMFNQILLNTDLIQCDSCNRLLYHDPDGGKSTADKDRAGPTAVDTSATGG
jgi:predicted  nucleic acid-binding Zn-ribbon protein